MHHREDAISRSAHVEFNHVASRINSVEECFEANRDVRVELAATSVEEFLNRLPASSPLNTLLLDIMLPGMNGIAGIPKLLEHWPDMDIIMLTNSDESDNIFRALQAGAVGYISKRRVNPTIIRDAVHTVHRGGSYMSPSIARQVAPHVSVLNAGESNVSHPPGSSSSTTTTGESS